MAPHLNMGAQTLAELMNREAEPLTEPLLTAALSLEKAGALLETPLSVPLTWQCYTHNHKKVAHRQGASTPHPCSVQTTKNTHVGMCKVRGVTSQPRVKPPPPGVTWCKNTSEGVSVT